MSRSVNSIFENVFVPYAECTFLSVESAADDECVGDSKILDRKVVKARNQVVFLREAMLTKQCRSSFFVSCRYLASAR